MSAKLLSRAEIAKHNNAGDCWIVINRNVYDVTPFLSQHPGGVKALVQFAGQDATVAFKRVHSAGVLPRYGKPMIVGRAEEIGEDSGDSHHILPLDAHLSENESSKSGADGAPVKHPPMDPPGALANLRMGVLNAGFGLSGFALNYGATPVYNVLAWAARKIAPIRGIKPNPDGSATKVAIIGAGCSGLSAAWLMRQTEGFDFTVYESQKRIGGHAYTSPFTGKDGHTVVSDLGYIFGGYYTYSNQLEMMDRLGCEIVHSEISTRVDTNGFQYASDHGSHENASPEYLKMTGGKKETWMHPAGHAECNRFLALCERFYENPSFNLMPFRIFLDMYGFSQHFRDFYLLPSLVILFLGEKMVWDMPSRLMFNMFAGFNKQCDLQKGHPCFTIKGGTNTWIQKLADQVGREHIRMETPVREVRRIVEDGKNKVLVVTDRQIEIYDHVVFSCGGKTAGLLLQHQSALEKWVFSQIRYEVGHTMCLHTDQSFIENFGDPDKKRNFNCRVVGTGKDARIEISGHFDQIYGQEKTEPRPVVTCSPLRKPQGDIINQHYCVIHQEDLYHLIITRTLLPMMQGSGNVWYGATWCNWIGHAAGIDAGMAVATRLGANYILENKPSREIYFKMAAEDMFGPRFEWWESVRGKRPHALAKL